MFESKSRLLTRRSTSRDLLDLWHFLTRTGSLWKMCLPSRQHPLNPGYEIFLDHGPKDLVDLVAELMTLIAEYEDRDVAQLAAAEGRTSPSLT